MPTEAQISSTNGEFASRLRGLAALVESCDRPVRIRIGARLRWSDAPPFETPILGFVDFTDRLTTFVTRQSLQRISTLDGPEADQLRTMFNNILSQQASKP